MRRLLVIFGMIVSSAFFSCDKKETANPMEKTIHVSIDKQTYSVGDDLIFSMQNLFGQPAYYIRCGGYPKPIPEIDKNEDGAWIPYWNVVCDTFLTLCCSEFADNQSITDTVSLQPGIGTGLFRLRFVFSEQDSNYQGSKFEVFSNLFSIE